jgi:hypothetical protein
VAIYREKSDVRLRKCYVALLGRLAFAETDRCLGLFFFPQYLRDGCCVSNPYRDARNQVRV